MKKMDKKGFTLAELLIVVAIIAVLVAIAIPIFNNQLEKSRDTTDAANLRAAYAHAQIDLMEGHKTYLASGYAYTVQSTDSGWVTGTDPKDALSLTSGGTKTPGGNKITFTTGTDGAITGYKWEKTS